MSVTSRCQRPWVCGVKEGSPRSGRLPLPLDEALDERRRLELRVAADERGVAPAGSDQLLVAAPFHDLAAVEDDDLVGVPGGRWARGGRNRRPPLRKLVERLLHEALGLRVERRRRL